MEANSLIPDYEIEASESDEQDRWAPELHIVLSHEASKRLAKIIQNPPRANDRLRAAMQRRFK